MAATTQVTPGVTGIEKLDRAGRSGAEQRRLAVVRAVFDGFSRGDFTVLVGALAPGARVWVLGVTPEPIIMDESTIGAGGGPLGNLAELMSNGMHFTINAVAAGDDHVFVEWIDEAVTSKGALYRNDGLSVFSFGADDRITSYHEYIDPRKFLAIL